MCPQWREWVEQRWEDNEAHVFENVWERERRHAVNIYYAAHSSTVQCGILSYVFICVASVEMRLSHDAGVSFVDKEHKKKYKQISWWISKFTV